MERGLGRDLEFLLWFYYYSYSINEESYPLELELHPAEFQLGHKEEFNNNVPFFSNFINKKLYYCSHFLNLNIQYRLILIRDFFGAAAIQHLLAKSNARIVYLEEFHINMRSSILYNWSWIITPALLSLDQEPCQFSFIVAISEHKLEGPQASSVSIKTQIFNWFMLDVCTKIAEEGVDMKKACFIMDNFSLYVSNTSTEFANKYKIMMNHYPALFTSTKRIIKGNSSNQSKTQTTLDRLQII